MLRSQFSNYPEIKDKANNSPLLDYANKTACRQQEQKFIQVA
jgi:hypothetical protein